jgi:hypothetical protein
MPCSGAPRLSSEESRRSEKGAFRQKGQTSAHESSAIPASVVRADALARLYADIFADTPRRADNLSPHDRLV